MERQTKEKLFSDDTNCQLAAPTLSILRNREKCVGCDVGDHEPGNTYIETETEITTKQTN